VNRNFLSLEDLQGSQSKSLNNISFCCQPDLQWMEQWMYPICRAPVRITYRYLEDDGTKVHMSLEDDGTKVHMSTRGNASGSIVLPYCVILRETKTTSSSGRFACKLSLSVLLLAVLFAHMRWFWTCTSRMPISSTNVVHQETLKSKQS